MEDRWRKATMVMTVVAGIEFLVLAAAGIALIGNPLAHRFQTEAARAAPAKTHTAKQPARPAMPRADTSVIVLNSGGRAGAAATTAARLRARGYIVSSVGNAAHPGDGQSVVMYRPGYSAEAARLARDMRVRVVSPLDGMTPAQLMGAHLVLLVS